MNFVDLLIASAITEIGDTTDFYQWRPQKADGTEFMVTFETENDRTYYVYGEQLPVRQDLMTVDFGVRGGFLGKGGGETVLTGEGNQFKVVSTVIRIVEQAWNNRHELFDRSETLGAIHFAPAKKEGEQTGEVTSRAKLYRAFIERQFPGAKIIKKRSNYIIRPEEML